MKKFSFIFSIIVGLFLSSLTVFGMQPNRKRSYDNSFNHNIFSPTSLSMSFNAGVFLFEIFSALPSALLNFSETNNDLQLSLQTEENQEKYQTPSTEETAERSSKRRKLNNPNQDSLKGYFFPEKNEQVKSEILKAVMDSLESKQGDESYPKDKKNHGGHHASVFEFGRFPDAIIKLDSFESMEKRCKNAERCSVIAKKNNLSCVIPDLIAVKLSKTNDAEANWGILIMEKINGLGWGKAQEISEQAFEKFDSDPDLKAHWKKLFLHAAEFICPSGYWDVAWSNIFLINDSFAFIDFEDVEVEGEKREAGIGGLLNMAPVEFFDPILEIAKKHGLEIGTIIDNASVSCGRDLEKLKNLRKETLQLRSQLRQWHKDNWAELDKNKANSYPRGTLERTILSRLRANPIDELMPETLIDRRTYAWQPFMNDVDYNQKASLDLALEHLKEEKLICLWVVEEKTYAPKLSKYIIYF